tara:strand:+ start:165 stop:1028 length:864 start_codon:yes stop_codon:yes gene_type:complete
MKIGILYQPKNGPAVEAIDFVVALLGNGGHTLWETSSWDIDSKDKELHDTDLLLSLGGDGTLLRAIRVGAPLGIYCLGINFGNLGFLTELESHEIERNLTNLSPDTGWIEQRVLIEWEHWRQGNNQNTGVAVNEIVVARGEISRVVDIGVRIDGADVVTYTADGTIVSTPTGSTGYTMAVQGPIMDPQANTFAITPICPFLTASNSLVTSSNSEIELSINTQHESGLTIDGQTHHSIQDGDVVKCTASPYPAKLLRFGPKNYFFPVLARKLRWSIPSDILHSDKDTD